MTYASPRPVVILYEHALLGEGIARYLLDQTGVVAIVAPVHACEVVSAALATDPALIIFEMGEPLPQGDLATLAPHALLIDVSAVVSRGSKAPSSASGLETISQAVRSISSTV